MTSGTDASAAGSAGEPPVAGVARPPRVTDAAARPGRAASGAQPPAAQPPAAQSPAHTPAAGATERLVRLLYFAVGVTALIFGGLSLPEFSAQLYRPAPWLSVFWWLLGFGLPLAMGILSQIAPLSLLRSFGAVQALGYVATIAFWLIMRTDTALTGSTPWVLLLIGLPAVVVAIIAPAPVAWSYVLLVSILSGWLRSATTIDAQSTLVGVQEGLYALLFQSVFVGLTLITRSGTARVEKATLRSRAADLQRASNAARKQERAMVDGLVHDSVISTLLMAGLARADRTVVAAEAASSLAKLDALDTRDATPPHAVVTRAEFIASLRRLVTDLAPDAALHVDQAPGGESAPAFAVTAAAAGLAASGAAAAVSGTVGAAGLASTAPGPAIATGAAGTVPAATGAAGLAAAPFGDVPATAATALLGAAGEALRNSVRSAGGDRDGLQTQAPAARVVTRVVSVWGAGGGIRLSVHDDGVGFDPADVATERLGIALSISGRMARITGGSAEIASAPGEGATVTVGWTPRAPHGSRDPLDAALHAADRLDAAPHAVPNGAATAGAHAAGTGAVAGPAIHSASSAPARIPADRGAPPPNVPMSANAARGADLARGEGGLARVAAAAASVRRAISSRRAEHTSRGTASTGPAHTSPADPGTESSGPRPPLAFSSTVGVSSALARVLLVLFIAVYGVLAFGRAVPLGELGINVLAYIGVCAAAAVVRPGPDPMPHRQVIGILLMCTVAAAFMFLLLPPVGMPPFAHWHLSAIALVLVMLIARRRTGWAWIGFALLTIGSVGWALAHGLGVTAGLDLVTRHAGTLVAGTLFLLALRRSRASLAVLHLANDHRAADDATETAGAQERASALARVNALARPALEQLRAGSDTSAADRAEFLMVEASLRDAIRGRSLFLEPVTSAARAARTRGVDVSLLDDSGDLLPVDQPLLARAVAAELDRVPSGRFTARVLPAGRADLATIVVDSVENRMLRVAPDGTVHDA